MIMIDLDLMMFKRRIELPELAQLTGIAPASLAGLCRGSHPSIRLDLLDRLCETLQCSPADLLVRIEEAPRVRLH
ncbi:helix-turn-helix domain-containing protein [Paenibacillus spiritus]|uniref:Helix-turn-helix domain-containing protein n=1 Tax=Paenibacillus spiritus TaxID=2496557 RepID=A0A5J5G563_9BACL|nr:MULTISPECIES: helix-turn-helix domain-containing protein [Paenibacillus]KAA9002406.1 helix-turn-helix domain-containing protein [Paenibacillus spiritus]